MTFIQNCLINNHTEQALDYINEINTSLDNTRITRYCNNEAINLILSSYISKANKTGITTQISVTASDFSGYKITDLCSLLANAIENASTPAPARTVLLIILSLILKKITVILLPSECLKKTIKYALTYPTPILTNHNLSTRFL